ncbi:hypothetical protein ACOSQ3_027324 [Xanthoceras sorbifolium]
MNKEEQEISSSFEEFTTNFTTFIASCNEEYEKNEASSSASSDNEVDDCLEEVLTKFFKENFKLKNENLKLKDKITSLKDENKVDPSFTKKLRKIIAFLSQENDEKDEIIEAIARR